MENKCSSFERLTQAPGGAVITGVSGSVLFVCFFPCVFVSITNQSLKHMGTVLKCYKTIEVAPFFIFYLYHTFQLEGSFLA